MLYRPNQKRACCPHYTLRLDSDEFKPSRDQRHAVNRLNRFVIGEDYVKEAARHYPLTREQARARDSAFNLVDRIHEAEAEVLKSKNPLQPAHQFVVTLEPDTFTEEKYSVFENYQRVVHGEGPTSISRKGFKRFLCDSPVRAGTLTHDGKERQVGSFHQCYRLDGKLVAVGVLDLLPHAVSAVYFMYHESIHRHQPGKLGALREIALAIEGGYRYWYPGYYIHSCPKMKYKVDYTPQYVLDPETLGWDLLDKEALAIFDRQPYVSLSTEREKLQEGNANKSPAPQQPSVHTDDETKPGVSHADGKDTEVAQEDGVDDEDEDEAMSLFTTDMPGIPSLEDLEHIDLDHIRVLSDSTEGFFTTGETVIWAADSIHRLGSLKSKIAELAATLGTDLLPEVVLDFRKSSRQRA